MNLDFANEGAKSDLQSHVIPMAGVVYACFYEIVASSVLASIVSQLSCDCSWVPNNIWFEGRMGNTLLYHKVGGKEHGLTITPCHFSRVGGNVNVCACDY